MSRDNTSNAGLSPESAASRWFGSDVVVLQPLGAGSSFSDVELWKLQTGGSSFVLRRWGPEWSARTLFSLQAYQMVLSGLLKHPKLAAVIPKPRNIAEGDFALHCGPPNRCAWTLVSWLPGEADYWRSPSAKKLDAALNALARLHRESRDVPRFDVGGCEAGMGVSPALAKRHARLAQLVDGELLDLTRRLCKSGDGPEHALSLEAIPLIEKVAARQLRVAKRVAGVELPLQWRHGDPWHDHILFDGDEVSGIIDFGAAGIDSPAGDVARLLGSLVGDDREGWQQGLESYQSVRPLSDDELEAVHVFDSSGTVISAANWIGWLRDVSGLNRPVIKNRPAAVERLRRLVERLRVLADGPRE